MVKKLARIRFGRRTNGWLLKSTIIFLSAACFGVPSWSAELVRFGIQIGGLSALRVTLPDVEKKFDLKYDFKEFRDSTAALLAIEQGEVDIANITAQHLVRAMDEGIPIVWVAGWGGGYNVLVAAKSLGLPKDDWKGMAALAKARAAEKKPIKIGVPTGSMQHLKLVVALRNAGIDPARDVEIVNIPFPTHPRAIDGGEVDFAMTLATFGAFSISGGKGALFAHVFDGAAGKQEIGLAVRRDTVEKRSEYLQRVVASYVEVMRSFTQDTNKQITLELKHLKLPEPVVAMVQRDFLRLSYHTNVSDLLLMAKQMKEIGWSKKENSDQLNNFVDFTFLAKATGETVDALKRW